MDYSDEPAAYNSYRPARKSRHIQRNKLMPIGFCLDHLVTKNKWSRPMQDNAILLHWETIVGESFARNVSVRWLKNKVLHVKTVNSQWTAAVRYQKKQLITNINEFFKEEIVREIVIDTVRPDDQKY